MKKNNKLLLLGALAFEGYRFYKGKGALFNKVRFKEQHDAVCKYIETHYSEAFYSDIVSTEDGWSCVVTTRTHKIVLYMTKTENGTFVFWEKNI